jgi:hypothetical protein
MIEVKIDFKDAITGDITKIKKQLDSVPREALTEYQKLTPKKTGNARRKTTLQGNTIQANYPYAEVLDAGRGNRDGQMRGSTQAPKGMTKPWEQWLQKRLDKIMKG